MPGTALRPAGRPQGINPIRLGRILRNVAIGNYFATATVAAGVPLPTARTWKQEGEQEVERIRREHNIPDIEVILMGWLEEHATAGDLDTYSERAQYWGNVPPWARSERWLHAVFFILVAHARARAEAAHIRNIRAAAEQDWRASAWFLERTRPQQFGRVDRIEQPQGPMAVEAAEVTTEQLVERIAVLRAMNSRAGDGE